MAAVSVTTGCSSVNCPLNNRVYAVWSLDGDTLTDTLNVWTERTDTGEDTVIINSQTGTTSFMLPVSYNLDTDKFIIQLKDTFGYSSTDTVWVSKTNIPHFESVECSPQYFHEITEVTHTYNGIKSIEIHDKNVTYDQTKNHLYIHFK